jgi:hypothetical protein
VTDHLAPEPIDDLLRRLAPARNTAYLRPGEDLTADAMLLRITSTVPPRRRFKWTRLTFFVTGTCVLAAAGVTTAVLRSRAPDDPTAVACHSSASPDDGAIMAVPAESSRTAIELCSAFWTDGTFGADGPPRLTACVTDADLIAVLPGDDTLCADRGWEVAELAESGAEDPATELLGRMSDRFAGRCLSPEEAVSAIGDIFDELGLNDWTIDSARAKAGCNAAYPDAARKLVVIAEIRQ